MISPSLYSTFPQPSSSGHARRMRKICGVACVSLVCVCVCAPCPSFFFQSSGEMMGGDAVLRSHSVSKLLCPASTFFCMHAVVISTPSIALADSGEGARNTGHGFDVRCWFSLEKK